MEALEFIANEPTWSQEQSNSDNNDNYNHNQYNQNHENFF